MTRQQQLPSVPESISLGQIQDLLSRLGLPDVSDLIRLAISIDGIQAEFFARDEQGNRYLTAPGSGQVATHFLSIRLEDRR